MCPDGRGKFPLHWCVEGCAIDYEVDGLFPCSFTLDEAVSVEMLSTLLSNGASPDVADRQVARPCILPVDGPMGRCPAPVIFRSADEFE